ncbi:cytochrome P450 [Colletotrichum sublineola]|uniref:Putative cytochrome P450 n=1 Tax=Colletotrichum sublineola TaxID=1173701 RepID=A0A066XV67_COLSU|nr:cytochrome P450 [Colletotrichum sublineola]KDN71599.1 putative cytochrome P450 [Colletotrichum sublineola]
MTVLGLLSERLASLPLSVWTAALIVLLVVFKATYNLFFHPLRSYPGPLLWRASRLPYIIRYTQGQIPYDLKRLHSKYGPVVRIAPDELTYNCSQAWRDIYGRNKQANGETALFNKDPILYSAIFAEHKALIDSDGDEHRPQKRTLAYAFSHQALVERGHIITGCIDRMIEGLNAYLGSPLVSVDGSSAVVDIGAWIENTLFDLGGQLTVGRDLNAIMSQGTVHPSLALFKRLFDWVQCYYLQFRRSPKILVNAIEGMPGFTGYDCVLPVKDVHDMILKRMAEEKHVSGDNSGDFASYLMSRAKSEGLQDDKVWINCVHLILGTPEAMPSSIISTIYHLLTTPYAYAEAVKEIREAFKSSDEITAQDVQNLPYLLACFRETLRRRPTIPGTLSRQVPPAGAQICGEFVRGGTIVGVNQFATSRSTSNFYDADSYRPERWLDPRPAEFESDDRDAFNPFGYGPRKCIARNLAHLTTQTFLAKLLWEFDMELNESCRNWDDQGLYVLALRGPLLVNLRRAAH